MDKLHIHPDEQSHTCTKPRIKRITSVHAHEWQSAPLELLFSQSQSCET